MPIGPLAPLLIPLGGQLLSDIIGGSNNRKANRESMEFQKYMYAQQRRDALSDWNMQNQYNSPVQQMARLKEAGLNPNLVYGNGATALSTQAPRSSSPGSYQARPYIPQNIGNMANTISSYYDTQVKQAQTDNLKAATEVSEQEKIKKAAETLKILQEKKTGEFDLSQKERLKDVAVDAATAEAKAKIYEADIKLTDLELKQAMVQPTAEKAIQEVINMKLDAVNKELDAILKQKQGKNLDADTAKKYQELTNLKTDLTLMQRTLYSKDLENELKEFDLRLKQDRGRASDYPSWMKPFSDIWQDLLKAAKGVSIPVRRAR